MESSEAKVQAVPEDRISALADQPGVTVYKYVHDAPAGVMGVEDQIGALREVCAAFDAGCRADRTATNECLREMVMQASPRARRFQQCYPRTFACVTVRAVNPHTHDLLEKHRKVNMMFLCEKWKGEGSDADKSARAMAVAARVAMRDTRPEDLKSTTTAKLDGGAAAAAGLPPLTPLDVKSFGGQVINQ